MSDYRKTYEANCWIGVDLDSTLAESGDGYDPAIIGEPIPRMADRVRRWLTEGKRVRIMTARVNEEVDGAEAAVARAAIAAWTLKHFGVEIPATCKKDRYMVALYDDRAKEVVKNTGLIVGTSEWWAANPRVYKIHEQAEAQRRNTRSA